jgi:hypothetical protein
MLANRSACVRILLIKFLEEKMKAFFIASSIAVCCVLPAQADENTAEVDAVVAGIKAANPDLKALCQKGSDAIRKASLDAVMSLMPSGKIKGNPQAVGGEAGKKIGAECRG